MELDLENNISTSLDTKEIQKFTQELNNTLNEDVNVYTFIDTDKLTNENWSKLWNKGLELIKDNICVNNISGANENELYKIGDNVYGGINVVAYYGNYENRESITVSYEDLPENVSSNMFFRKVGDNYVFDKETTELFYNEMKNYENELLEQQNEYLQSMRIEGATYQITNLEDDCETWHTELTNLETGETFQEIDFPHEIYHYVGLNSQVKYENGTYTVVEGTSLSDLYPNIIENYCEIEGVYVTPTAKYKTCEELYEALSLNSSGVNNMTSKSFYDNLNDSLNSAISSLKNFINEKINSFNSLLNNIKNFFKQ